MHTPPTSPALSSPSLASRFSLGAVFRFLRWAGLAMCLFDLVLEELTIWVGGANIQTVAPLAALAKELARGLAGAGWQTVVVQIYGAMWLIHYLVFMSAFWACSRDSKAQPGKTGWLIALQALAAFAGNGQLVLGVAAQIAYYYGMARALPALFGLCLVRALADLPYFLGLTGVPPVAALLAADAVAYQIRDIAVVFAMGYIARLAWQGSARLAAANAELRATERKLAEAERDAERMRIARDLHDNVGHQLTAISLHLDLGMRRAGAEVPGAIRNARELAGAALAKLRVAVTRESSAVEEAPAPQAPTPQTKGLSHVDMFAWFGVVICLYAMCCDEAVLWKGGIPILTFDVIYPVCRWLVQAILPAGAPLEPALHMVYSWSWVVFYLAFGTAFWIAAREPHTGRKVMLLWWVQIVLAVVWHAQYTYAVLPQVAYRLPLHRALRWFAVMVVAAVIVVGPFLLGWTVFPRPGAISLWYFPLKVLRDLVVFFCAGLLARAVAQQRARLAGINAELREARQRLAEAARMGERLRISSELNDVLGHELAALNLQLDLGMRQSADHLAESVGVAQQAGRRLFDNIKLAIERDKAAVTDFSSILQALCAGVPQPRVQLKQDPLPPLSPELAHCLYSCVQEGITNAVRHAQAGNLVIGIEHDSEHIVLAMADDGIGMRSTEGNGLRGMRTRVGQLGGSMQLGAGPEQGCRIEIRIPVGKGIMEKVQASI